MNIYIFELTHSNLFLINTHIRNILDSLKVLMNRRYLKHKKCNFLIG